jgi:spore coat protein U-like protein
MLPVAVDNLSHTTTVGRIEQDCNNAGGYTLDVTSLNCALGARLDGPGANEVTYSVNSDNGSPTPDGTWDVTGLLASVCTGQIARTASAPVTDYFTDLGVVFTASTSLFPGSYTDTLTITLTATY